MESYLNENFDLIPKNMANEALQRWRKLRGVVNNRKRRFRFTATLSKRSEAEAIRRTNQGSVGSFRSFGSTDDQGYHQDVEIPVGIPFSISSPSITDFIGDMSSPSVTDFVLDLGQDHQEAHPAEASPSPPPDNQPILQPWAKVIIVMAFTMVVGLMSVNYTINGSGNLTPSTLFSGRPMSFGFFLVVVMATFYVAVIAMIIRPVLPLVSKILNIIAFVCVVLGVTVLLWAMLPKSISRVPWIFFGVTIFVGIGVIVYDWFAYVKSVKNTNIVPRVPSFHGHSM